MITVDKAGSGLLPTLTTPVKMGYDAVQMNNNLFGIFERQCSVHNHTNMILYVRNSHDFVFTVEPEVNSPSIYRELGQHVLIRERYTLRDGNDVHRTADLIRRHLENGTVNKNLATAYLNVYDRTLADMCSRFGKATDARKITTAQISFVVIYAYSYDSIRSNSSIYAKNGSMVFGFTEDAVSHVYPASENLPRTKEFTGSQFHENEVYGSIRLVDNHREIGDQYVWLMGSVRHIPAVVDTSVESGFYIVEPRTCTGEVIHRPTYYSFKDAYRIFHIRPTQREAVEVGDPSVSEEVAIRGLERKTVQEKKETELIAAQNRRSDAEASGLKAMMDSFLRIQNITDENSKIKSEKKERKDKSKFEKMERIQKALYEKQKLELEQIAQRNKLKTEKKSIRNKERSEKTKVFSDILKTLPAIALGVIGVIGLFKQRRTA